MWPFDLILENRVKDLEKSLELTIGYNTVLRNQLERSENREEQLLQKIFELTGINKSPVSSPTHTGEAIQLNKIGKSWPKIKENLELKSRQEYWERKQKEKEVQNQNSEKIEQLEKEVEVGL